MRRLVSPVDLIGFLIACAFSVGEQWSLPEFCWSTWLAGLVFSWVCVVTGALQIIFNSRGTASALTQWIPATVNVTLSTLRLGLVAAASLVGVLALLSYNFLFGFYGVFLSVFAEMEPASLFGRNGFINSDFSTPVMHLLRNFWPMTLSMLIASAPDVLRGNPWARVVRPFESDVFRVHVMVIAMPMLSMATWAVLGDRYQQVTIVLLIGIFFLLGKRAARAPKLAMGRVAGQTR